LREVVGLSHFSGEARVDCQLGDTGQVASETHRIERALMSKRLAATTASRPLETKMDDGNLARST
jgi:hypothetical protein